MQGGGKVINSCKTGRHYRLVCKADQNQPKGYSGWYGKTTLQNTRISKLQLRSWVDKKEQEAVEHVCLVSCGLRCRWHPREWWQPERWIQIRKEDNEVMPCKRGSADKEQMPQQSDFVNWHTLLFIRDRKISTRSSVCWILTTGLYTDWDLKLLLLLHWPTCRTRSHITATR